MRDTYSRFRWFLFLSHACLYLTNFDTYWSVSYYRQTPFTTWATSKTGWKTQNHGWPMGIIITDYDTRGSILDNVSDNPHIFDGKPLLDAYIPYQITINQCVGAKDSQGMSSSWDPILRVKIGILNGPKQLGIATFFLWNPRQTLSMAGHSP